MPSLISGSSALCAPALNWRPGAIDWSPLMNATVEPALSSREELALQLADDLVVEGDVEVRVAVGDQAVVGDDRDSRLLRLVGDRRAGGLVERRDDDHVGAVGDRRLGLRHLPRRVALGVVGDHLRARRDLLHRSLEQRLVLVLEAVGAGRAGHQEGDLQALPLCRRCRPSCSSSPRPCRQPCRCSRSRRPTRSRRRPGRRPSMPSWRPTPRPIAGASPCVLSSVGVSGGAAGCVRVLRAPPAVRPRRRSDRRSSSPPRARPHRGRGDRGRA